MNDGLIAAWDALEEARYMRALAARLAQREHLWQTVTGPEHEKKYRCATCKREVFAAPGYPNDTPDCPGPPQ